MWNTLVNINSILYEINNRIVGKYKAILYIFIIYIPVFAFLYSHLLGKLSAIFYLSTPKCQLDYIFYLKRYWSWRFNAALACPLIQTFEFGSIKNYSGSGDDQTKKKNGMKK